MPLERCKSGITGLDGLLEGGFPLGSSIVVTGTPGAAKTLFALHFIVNGVLQHGEKGIYVTIEEKIDELTKHFSEFGYDLKKLQEEEKILIIAPQVKVEEGDDLFQQIISRGFTQRISQFGAKRIVIDPLNLVFQFSREYGGKRREIENLIAEYKKLGLTILFTYERTTAGPPSDITYAPPDFVTDGIIYLQVARKEGIFDKEKFFQRRLTILKMRGTNHGQGTYEFKIEKDGLHVYS